MENEPLPSSSSTWLVGVLLMVVSTVGNGISRLAIRKSWLLQKQEATTTAAPSSTTSFARMRHVSYLFMAILCPMFDVSAMAFASPSILAPLSGLTMAFVVLMSKQVLGEVPGKKQLLAAFLVVIGEVVVAVFGDHSSGGEGLQTLQDMRESYLDPPFVRYLLLALVLEGGMIYTMLFSANPYWKRLAWGVAGGFLTGFQNFIKDAMAVVQIMPTQGQNQVASSNAINVLDSSALPSSPPLVVVMKMLSFLLQLPVWFWVLLLLGIGTAMGGLAITAECMKRYDATYSSGSFVGSMTLSASLMSAVHYHTLDHLQQQSHLVFYPVGLTLVLVGVGLLTTTTTMQHHHVSEDDDSAHGSGNHTKHDDNEGPHLLLSEITSDNNNIQTIKPEADDQAHRIIAIRSSELQPRRTQQR